MTRDERLQLNKVNKKCHLSLLASVSLVILLTIIKMVFSNQFATRGKDLEFIKKQTYKLQKQNQRFNQELAQKTGGLDNLAEIAKENGFTDKPNYQYFTSPLSVAQKLP